MEKSTASPNVRRAALTVIEFAEEIRESRNTAYGLVAAGEIKAVRLGRRLLIPFSEIRFRVIASPAYST